MLINAVDICRRQSFAKGPYSSIHCFDFVEPLWLSKKSDNCSSRGEAVPVLRQHKRRLGTVVRADGNSEFPVFRELRNRRATLSLHLAVKHSDEQGANC